MRPCLHKQNPNQSRMLGGAEEELWVAYQNSSNKAKQLQRLERIISLAFLPHKFPVLLGSLLGLWAIQAISGMAPSCGAGLKLDGAWVGHSHSSVPQHTFKRHIHDKWWMWPLWVLLSPLESLWYLMFGHSDSGDFHSCFHFSKFHCSFAYFYYQL